jgi:hypothetical protein
MSAIANTCNAGVQDIIVKCVTESVHALAKKHGFDVKEALASLDIGNMAAKATDETKAKPLTAKEKKALVAAEKAKAKEDKPKKEKTKRAPTGYMLYSADQRPDVKKELTDALADGEKLKPQLVLSKLGANWKAEDQAVRDKWNITAKTATPVASDTEEAKE